MVTLILFKVAALVPLTLTVMVQVEFAGMLPPLRVTEPLPAVAVGAVPPQVSVKPFGVATLKPAGNVSVKANAANAVLGCGLVIVKVRVDAPLTPSGTFVLGLMALVMLGGRNDVPFTTKLALRATL